MPIYSSTITDIASNKMSKPYYRITAANQYFTVSDNAIIDDIFDDGGTISIWVNPESDGENSLGRVWDKSANDVKGYKAWVHGEGGREMNFSFQQNFSTTDGTWVTGRDLPMHEWTNIVVAYNNSNVANNPVIYFNGVAQTLTETTPVGTRDSDDGENLRIGNRTMTNVNVDGLVSEFRAYNTELSAAEVADISAGRSVPYHHKGTITQAEKITNGTFASDASWTKGTGWSIGSGVATSTGSNNGAYLSQGGIATFGKAYKITFTVTAISSGSVRILSSGWGSTNYRSTTGTFTETVFWDGGDGTLYFQANSNFVGSIDNVSVVAAGALIDLDGSSVSGTKWYDKSGNNLDATVSGAQLENTSTGNTFFSNSGTARGIANLEFYTDGAATNQRVASIIMEQGSGDGSSRKAQIIFKVSDNAAPATAVTIFNNKSMQAAGGVLFGGDTAAANILDDYEEGTWTPTLSGYSSTTLGLSQATGVYTKIGQMVIATFRLTVNDLNSVSSNYMLLGGLPFPHGSGNTGSGIVNYFGNLESSVSSLSWDISSTTTVAWLTGVSGTGNTSGFFVGSNYFGGNEVLQGTLIYQT